MIIFGSFLPSLLVGSAPPTLLGHRSRQCHGIITLKIPVSQVGLLRLTGGEEANEPGRGTHQERQRAGTRAREPSSASVGKARFCHRCRRLATERRVVFSRRSR